MLERIFEAVFASKFSSRQLSIVWHAGEPTTVGIPFYEAALNICEAQRPRKTVITHHLQTNGTQFDGNWCAFLKERAIHVGVSVDGPLHLHDSMRRYRSGRGSFEATLRGIKHLQQHCVPFSALAVVTERTLDYVKEFHDFFVSQGCKRLAFNVEEIENTHTQSSMAGESIAGRFRTFVSELYDLSISSGLAIREFVRARDVLRHLARTGQPPQITSLYSVAFDVDGGFAVFDPELLGARSPEYGDFTLGHVRDEGLDVALSSAGFGRMHAAFHAGIQACRDSCEFFSVCGGGSASNKLFENGRLDSTETMHCRLMRQVLFSVVVDKLLASNHPPVALSSQTRLAAVLS